MATFSDRQRSHLYGDVPHLYGDANDALFPTLLLGKDGGVSDPKRAFRATCS